MTHPLTALIAGVPRFCNTSDALMAEDPMGAYVHWHDLIAALEAAPHVNETPKTEHDGADVLSATPPDLVEAAIAELQDVMRCRCDKAFTDRGMHDPDCQCDSQDALDTLIALATAQAAQIAGLQDKLAFVQRREIASNTKFDEKWSDAQADAATLRAEVERLRGAGGAEARSQAIREFCQKAGIAPSVEVSGLPDDVKLWRMETAVEQRESATCECGEQLDAMDAIICNSGASLCHPCAASNLRDALSLTTDRLEELFIDADLTNADEGYAPEVRRIIGQNRAILRALEQEGGDG